MTTTSITDAEDITLDPQRHIIAKEIGARVAAARAARSMTQVGLAMRSAVDPSYLSRVENGHSLPSIDVIDRLCRALSLEGTPITLEFIVYGRGQ